MSSNSTLELANLLLSYLHAVQLVDSELSRVNRKRPRTWHPTERTAQERSLALASNARFVSRMSAFEFKRTYRFSWSSFERLCAQMHAHEIAVAAQAKAGRPPTAAVDVRLLMTLEFLATGE